MVVYFTTAIRNAFYLLQYVLSACGVLQFFGIVFDYNFVSEALSSISVRDECLPLFPQPTAYIASWAIIIASAGLIIARIYLPTVLNLESKGQGIGKFGIFVAGAFSVGLISSLTLLTIIAYSFYCSGGGGAVTYILGFSIAWFWMNAYSNIGVGKKISTDMLKWNVGDE